MFFPHTTYSSCLCKDHKRVSKRGIKQKGKTKAMKVVSARESGLGRNCQTSVGAEGTFEMAADPMQNS